MTVILFMGLWTMFRGGSPNLSQNLMRARVIAQAVAIVVIWRHWHCSVAAEFRPRQAEAKKGTTMVKLNKIYTKTGDDGTTGLVRGPRRPKFDLRVAAYGTRPIA